MTDRTKEQALSALRQEDLDGLRELARRAQESAAPPDEPAVVRQRPKYRNALSIAAFLGGFDPARLLPDATRDELQALVNDCSISSSNGRSEWQLKSSVRSATLAQLAQQAQGLLEGAFRARDYLKGELDPIAQAAIRLASGQPPTRTELLHMGKTAIAAWKAALEWLKQMPAGMRTGTDPDQLLAEIQMTELLDPFRFLTGYDPQTGADLFIGRKTELRELRIFVDVLESEGLMESTRRASTRAFSAGPRMLFISGIGGIGKSTLLAKFLLQHVEQGGGQGIRFAYLDFDRSSLSAAQPVTLLLEMLRQLAWQMPAARAKLDALRETVRIEAQADARKSGQPQPPMRAAGGAALPPELLGPTALDGALRELDRILDSASWPDKPLLLVLDTFEEAQALGDEGVLRVQAFLDAAGEALPALRTVLVGRDAAEGFFPDARRLVLEEYDQASRRTFLESRGVPARISAKVARALGGRPLALQLAARLVLEQGIDAASLSVTEKLKGFFNGALIEGVLYRRILDHIHDPDVRHIAHPGLVLRRINAEVIERVLIPALRLTDFDARKTEQVMDALRKQKDLVRVEADGSVTHRPDVREQMLALMQAEDLERVRALHRAAAAYYRWKQEQFGEATPAWEDARVEEIYHLLGAGDALERIPELWIDKARLALGFALQELPSPRARGTLKVMLGRTPTEEEESVLPPLLLAEYAQRAAAAALLGNQPDKGLSYLNSYARHIPDQVRLELLPRLLDRAGYWSEARPYYRELLSARGLVSPHLLLDVADFFERQPNAYEEQQRAFARLQDLERYSQHLAASDALRVSLAVRRLQMQLAQGAPEPSSLDDFLSGAVKIPRAWVQGDLLRWLVTLRKEPDAYLLRLVRQVRITESIAGQLRFLAMLARPAEEGPHALRRAAAMAETLAERRGAALDFGMFTQPHELLETWWLLLQHVLRPFTPQWYVPFAAVLLGERGGVTSEEVCGALLPVLPFQAPRRMHSTKSLADFLGQLDELGVLQIVLQDVVRRGEMCGAERLRRMAELLHAYMQWRAVYFREMDGMTGHRLPGTGVAG